MGTTIRTRRVAPALVALAALGLAVGACAGSSPPPATTTVPATTGPDATTTTTTTPTTTGPVATTTTTSTTTAAPTTVPPTSTATSVPAPPGRLPATDAAPFLATLVPTDERAGSPLELLVRTVDRLRARAEAEGDDARISHGSSSGVTGGPHQPAGTTYAFVLEIRTGEARGDDSSSGYDLIVYVGEDDAGWFVGGGARQQLCTRGVTLDGPPLCV